MNRALVVAFVASVLTFVCLLLIAVREHAAASDYRQKADKLDAHCTYVRNAMRMDWRELQLPEFQKRAAERFYENVTGHSVMEITMCITKPVDLSRHDSCFLANDYACLSEMAKAAELAIPRSSLVPADH